MRRILPVVFLSLFLLGPDASTADADTDMDPIVVIDVGDPLDQRAIDYLVDAVSSQNVHLFILKINSPGVSSGDLASLLAAVDGAAAPVLSWVGPQPAVAYGGVGYLANHADIRSAAPGSVIGFLDPAIQRGRGGAPSVRSGTDPEAFLAQAEALTDSTETVTVDNPVILGFVDRVDPALGQLIVSLDGTVVTRGSESWEISTASTQVVDGEERIVATRTVTFVKPGLIDRFLRLGARPETTFLFLLIGLAFVTFEFYAAGRGLMAVVGSVSLVVAGYGLATLPMWWPALAMVFGGLGIMVWGFAQNRVDWRAVVGTALVLASGFLFTTSRPAYPPRTWMVIVAVAGSVVFIWYSLTTVVRGRFATPTVGREELLGKGCVVVSSLNPEGVVMVDGSRWRATADRGVVIGAGGGGKIVGVTGLVLEVDPIVLGEPAGREEIS